jgi:hypothetical protein
MAKAFISPYLNPSLFKYKNMTVEILVYGLRPDTEHAFFEEGTTDITENTLQISKGENFGAVYDYYYNNVLSPNYDKDGNQIKYSADHINRKILFDDYNFIDSTTRTDNVISFGEVGAPLKTDQNGVLAFYYFVPDNATSDALDQTSLKINNFSTFLNKNYVIKTPDGTSKKTLYIGRKLLKNYNIDTVDNDSFATGSVGGFNIAQTFYIDPSLVKNATEINITSVELFVKEKPIPSAVGIKLPGITVFIAPCKNRIPVVSSLASMPSSRLEWDQIIESKNASVASKFSFKNAIPLKTNTEYAIIIKYDGLDAGYKLHSAKQGEWLLGTKEVSGGVSGQFVGNYFTFSSYTSNWIASKDIDLKFNINAARYAVDTTPISEVTNLNVTNKSYEFMHFNELNSTTNFYGNEKVFQVKSNLTGTISVSNTTTTVTGNGTTFSTNFVQGADPEYIAINNGSNVELREVVGVVSNTVLTIDRPTSFTNTVSTYYKTPVAWVHSLKNSYLDGGRAKLLMLYYSQANSNLYFTNNSTIVGDISGASVSNVNIIDFRVNRMVAAIDTIVPAQSTFVANAQFNYTIASNGDSIEDPTPFTQSIKMFSEYFYKKEDAIVVPSRSREIAILNTSPIYAYEQSNAVSITITPTFENDFVAPKLQANLASVVLYRYVINNDYTDEHTKYGNAFSKHITTRVNLDPGVSGEDIIVYLTGYRPPGTNFKVYAKLYNNKDKDAYDDKDWTLLEAKTTATTGAGPTSPRYSTSNTDILEFTYGLPQYPNTTLVSNGLVTTTLNQTNVVGVNTSFTTNFANNDLVKIYPALFPNTYEIGVVSSITNSTLMTLQTEITNTSVTGSGLKIEKLGYKHQAFNNITNDNVVRYFSTSMTEFDKFDSFGLKIVFLSNDQYVTPYISGLRAVAAST